MHVQLPVAPKEPSSSLTMCLAQKELLFSVIVQHAPEGSLVSCSGPLLFMLSIHSSTWPWYAQVTTRLTINRRGARIHCHTLRQCFQKIQQHH